MRRLTILPLLLLSILNGMVFADAPKASIKGPSKVATGGTIVLDAQGSVADRPLRWKFDGPDVPFLELDKGNRVGVVLFVPAAPAGVYRFTLIARGIPPGEVEIDADAAMWTVTVEDPQPAPTPDPTPTPEVKPKPIPTPTPSPQVVPAGKLRVLLLWESEGPYTRDLLIALNSPRISDYLTTHCMADLDGRYAWRWWDKDTDPARASPTWQAAFVAAKADPKPIPKVVVFAGETVVASAPIVTEQGLLDFLQTYGGK